MENPKTIFLSQILSWLAQKTTVKTGDFSIAGLATEMKEAIKPLTPEYEWFSEQLSFLIDTNILESDLNDPKNQKMILKELNRLSHVTAYVPGVSALANEEIVVAKLFNEEASEEKYLLYLYSLRQLFFSETRHDIVLQFIEYLKNNPEKITKISESDKRVLYILCWDLVWLNLSALPPEIAEYCIANFWLQSLSFFCPVEIALSTYLSLATNLNEYEAREEFIKNSISKNKEIIAGLNVSLNELYSNYIDTNWLTNHQSLLENPAFSASIKIFQSLDTSTLGRPFSGEDSVGTEYDYELLQLATWFLKYENWEKVIKNFLQEKPLVSFKVFVNHLTQAFELNTPETLEIITKFQDLCWARGVLSKDKDLILYNESTGQFEWNAEFLT